MRLHCFCNTSVSLKVTRVLKISLLLTIILTGCANNPTDPTIIKYKGVKEGEKVFQDIANIIESKKKRTVAIIDFPDKESKEIEQEGKNVA
ncbi:hypothetical protein VU04_08155, partial [Desulfobulbus sp. TB]|nr:hypothetical protein [Desulfobulbus sp. TB]